MVPWLLLLLPAFIQNLNLDKKPQTLSGPPGSHFGFSMDFYNTADQGMSIVVGAPRMQTSQRNVTMGGGVFLCPWKPKGSSCVNIKFDSTGDRSIPFAGYTMKIFKSNQWFGATVRTWNTAIVACAPFQQWNVMKLGSESGTTPTGTCYITNNLEDIYEFAPCRESKMERHYEADRRFCELGFSTDINKDGTLLAGAPWGYFQGLYVTAGLPNILARPASSSLLQSYPGQQISPYIGSSFDSYKGFSVAYGEFTGDNTPEIVVGSPKYQDRGLVDIYTVSNPWKTFISFLGKQVASYFGHSVAVTDVNNDGRDDVLVGAPLFMERRTRGKLQEFGQVYVYLQRENRKFSFNHPVLTGSQVYGRFGSSIAPLGDIDQDGFNDVAVGAPFGGESGGGCVFIYRGSPAGLSPQPSQILESPLPPPAQFGFALRGGMDIDNNGYPDLLVGAFHADKVFIFRTQPVVVLQASLFFNPEALNPDEKLCNFPQSGPAVSCFTIRVCAQASGRSLPKKISLSAELQLDRLKSRFARRTFFLDSSQPSKTIDMELQSNSAQLCQNLTPYLRGESEFKDKLSPIAMSVNFSLVRAQSMDTVQPTLHGTTFLQEQTNILLDCGDDNVCIPNLHLTANWSADPLLIGIDNLVHVQFNAANLGEGAYEAELYVWLPNGAHYMQVLGEAEEKILCSPKKGNESEIVVCELGNPMKNGAEIHADLQLSFSNLEDSGSTVTFQMQIKSRNTVNSASSLFLVTMAVKVTASLELRGSSHPAEVILPLPNWEPREEWRKAQDYGEEVTHVYELHNSGPGSVHVQLLLQSPEMYHGDYFLYPLRLEVDDGMTCDNQSALNPLKLDILTSTEEPANYSSRSGDHRLERRDLRRWGADEGMQEDGVNITKKDEKPPRNHTVLLNCSSFPCWEVQCSVQNLERGGRATVKLHSILWVPSFLKRQQQQFVLLSQGSFWVTSVPYKIQPAVLLYGNATANTTVLWVSPDGQKEIPLWWIIVGALGGLLLLALFVFVMWKLGFFRRTRPPSDDQEDLTSD
ncbi:integrin, alpha 2b (platelet glycoprotein IIb of IIb/IIIa complex, antigen CD41), gene 2 L homeolog precursor [Xenopus laevis]|uniref:Integrin, alpha 2b (Platelet glycoprotein IIb of IIb/IIIa complex, antigen CD41), gene 2 L homeolog precursor n=1 Tax=Xenopus laevis TaxID=8355 RepID=Q5XH72_XENLA|nr:integrin, alpha 2b (platelet glycoprotein IIb of IIb/IIIa complex, antigen CD41), gene 2 L homeolog precursor [Xenopus laevis]AAH84201.1 LOC495051 protein [Xenopus laevis]